MHVKIKEELTKIQNDLKRDFPDSSLVPILSEILSENKDKQKAAANKLERHYKKQSKSIATNDSKDSKESTIICYVLGFCFVDNIGKDQDLKKAFKFFSTVDQYANAQYWLRQCYEWDNRVAKGMPEAKIAQIEFDLGLHYIRSRDDEKATRFFQASAAKGLKTAQHNLGLNYRYGRGVEKDSKKAFKLFEASAAQMYARGQYQLGIFYYDGDESFGLKPNFTKAFSLFSAAYSQELKDVQYYLGLCYLNGHGIAKDSVRAVNLFLEIKDKNDSVKYQLALCYLKGDGIIKNEKIAISLLIELAKKGHNESLDQLYDLALEHYAKALKNEAENGDLNERKEEINQAFNLFFLTVNRDVKYKLLFKYNDEGRFDAKAKMKFCQRFFVDEVIECKAEENLFEISKKSNQELAVRNCNFLKSITIVQPTGDSKANNSVSANFLTQPSAASTPTVQSNPNEEFEKLINEIEKIKIPIFDVKITEFQNLFAKEVKNIVKDPTDKIYKKCLEQEKNIQQWQDTIKMRLMELKNFNDKSDSKDKGDSKGNTAVNQNVAKVENAKKMRQLINSYCTELTNFNNRIALAVDQLVSNKSVEPVLDVNQMPNITKKKKKKDKPSAVDRKKRKKEQIKKNKEERENQAAKQAEETKKVDDAKKSAALKQKDEDDEIRRRNDKVDRDLKEIEKGWGKRAVTEPDKIETSEDDQSVVKGEEFSPKPDLLAAKEVEESMPKPDLLEVKNEKESSPKPDILVANGEELSPKQELSQRPMLGYPLTLADLLAQPSRDPNDTSNTSTVPPKKRNIYAVPIQLTQESNSGITVPQNTDKIDDASPIVQAFSLPVPFYFSTQKTQSSNAPYFNFGIFSQSDPVDTVKLSSEKSKQLLI